MSWIYPNRKGRAKQETWNINELYVNATEDPLSGSTAARQVYKVGSKRPRHKPNTTQAKIGVHIVRLNMKQVRVNITQPTNNSSKGLPTCSTTHPAAREEAIPTPKEILV